MTDREAMKLALEALEDVQEMMNTSEWFNERVQAVRQAIEQPEQEPVAWLDVFTDEAYSNSEIDEEAKADLTPLYTAPPRKEWVGLTDDEIQDFGYEAEKFDKSNSEWFDRFGFARAIEAKLKEKNHG